jgi:acetyl-CoA/propionyl-CoA carboxylase biotin carboxyl carrier protein
VFDSVLVANRGEIARRVIRTLRRLGVRSVAVYTDVDRRAPHVREADDALEISSYLDVDAVVAAASRAGAQALHPGYGFLSENPALARACAAAGVTFVGPPPDAMEAMADKVRAKAVAERAGVPVVPSFTPETAEYPVLVKAAAGGGGRGMRVVERAEDLQAAVAAAKREALAGFGDDTVFLERFLPRARHIEVQVIGDRHGTVRHLGERECSLQRRHQKVIEEAPSPVVSAELRARLGAEAVALAGAVGYEGAGTVEFIADFEDPSEHYFLEMNARLQVEHPVTEMVTGLDLVELQLRVAAGESLPAFKLRMDGHAIEARVNAEDAQSGFLPSSGRVLAYRRPAGAGIRVDDAIEAGSVVGTEYDSMIAKVIAHAGDRETALARLDRALAGTAVLGVTTTTAFLRALLGREEVRRGLLDTGFIERVRPAAEDVPAEEVAEAAAVIHMAVRAESASDDPFDRVDGWRLGGLRAGSFWRLAVDGGEPLAITVPARADIERVAPDAFAITSGDGVRRQWAYAYEDDHMWLGRDGHAWRLRQASGEEAHEAHVHGDLRAPMPGSVLLVPATVGDEVKAGDAVVVLESMKMELSIAAPVDGVVKEITVAVGDRVARDQSLARVE